MSLSERELSCWLNTHCTQKNNWILQTDFLNIIGSPDTTYLKPNKDTLITTEKFDIKELKHIFFCYMTNNKLIAAIMDTDDKLYVIRNDLHIEEKDNEVEEKSDKSTINLNESNDNKNEQQEDNIRSVKSTIISINNVSDIMKTGVIPKSVYNQIGLQKVKSIKIKTEEKAIINRLNYLDILKPPMSYTSLDVLTKMVTDSEVLNLSHNYYTNADDLNRLQECNNVKAIVLNQNNQLTKFDWLGKFPNLEELHIDACQVISQEEMEDICKHCKNLRVFEARSCMYMNIRILIPLFRLRKLQQISILDPYFLCQESAIKPVILHDEWKLMKCDSLSGIIIDSENISLDVMDYIIECCGNIQTFIIDEKVLQMVNQNVDGGLTKDFVIFSSIQECEKQKTALVSPIDGTPLPQNRTKGLKVYRQIKFKNMYKDRKSMFSDAMLRKIKQQKGLSSNTYETVEKIENN